MKKFLSALFAVTLLFSSVFALPHSASASVRVHGYTRRSTHTYVAPHYRSNPDKTRRNNYSTKGNINPYTGKKGTKSLYTAPRSYRHY